jgi:hypothetical protein
MQSSVCVDALTRPQTVKTRQRVKPRPRGKRGCGRRPDGNFYHWTSVMTTLVHTGLVNRFLLT